MGYYTTTASCRLAGILIDTSRSVATNAAIKNSPMDAEKVLYTPRSKVFIFRASTSKREDRRPILRYLSKYQFNNYVRVPRLVLIGDTLRSLLTVRMRTEPSRKKKETCRHLSIRLTSNQTVYHPKPTHA